MTTRRDLITDTIAGHFGRGRFDVEVGQHLVDELELAFECSGDNLDAPATLDDVASVDELIELLAPGRVAP